MTTTAVQNYSKKFPEEIAKAIDGLSGRTEKAVFIVLFNEGELAFTELREELGDEEQLHQETLSNALSNLKDGGLIRQQILEDEDESPFTSYYVLSEYGERFVHSLFDSLGTLEGTSGRRKVAFTQPRDNLIESTQDLAKDLEKKMEKKQGVSR
ncbi:MAG: hypothetical protein ABEI86_06985 [Halobacteriaceae archaeon]